MVEDGVGIIFVCRLPRDFRKLPAGLYFFFWRRAQCETKAKSEHLITMQWGGLICICWDFEISLSSPGRLLLHLGCVMWRDTRFPRCLSSWISLPMRSPPLWKREPQGKMMTTENPHMRASTYLRVNICVLFLKFLVLEQKISELWIQYSFDILPKGINQENQQEQPQLTIKLRWVALLSTISTYMDIFPEKKIRLPS